MRVLLLQARFPDDPALAEEVRSFARACELEPANFASHDLLTGPPRPEALATSDVVMFGPDRMLPPGIEPIVVRAEAHADARSIT